MNCVRTRILCMGMVALVVFSLVGTSVAAVQEKQKGKARDGVVEDILPDGTMEVPVIAIYGGQGFAFKRDEEGFHTLRIHIIWVRQIEPAVIRDFMEEDMSIEEIRGEIRDRGKEQLPFYRGYMRFVGDPYRLVNISVTPEGANVTIKADVRGTVQGSESNGSVGNISVTAMDYEGVRISKGWLTMHGENYRVLLGVLPTK